MSDETSLHTRKEMERPMKTKQTERLITDALTPEQAGAIAKEAFI